MCSNFLCLVSKAIAPPLSSYARLSCLLKGRVGRPDGALARAFSTQQRSWTAPESSLCSQGLLCYRGEWCLSGTQHRALSSSLTFMVSHEHQNIILQLLWMASPSRAFTCCLYWWIWGASVLQCPAHSHEHSPRICTHTRPGLRFPWVWDPPERFVKGKVSAGTIVWHWGGWRCGTRAQECSSQLSELRFSGCILTVSPPCVSLLALSSASASSRLVPCRAVALSHRLWLPNKFGLC